MPAGGGGKGPDGGGAGRIGRLKASLSLDRFDDGRTEVLDVRGGKPGRSNEGPCEEWRVPLRPAE